MSTHTSTYCIFLRIYPVTISDKVSFKKKKKKKPHVKNSKGIIKLTIYDHVFVHTCQLIVVQVSLLIDNILVFLDNFKLAKPQKPNKVQAMTLRKQNDYGQTCIRDCNLNYVV